jgi:Cu(I)/Ag(I) efflux system membrane fusion protein
MDHLVDSAKRRLRLWNITDEQIAELEKSRKPQESLMLKSPFKGIVQELAVDQGRRAMTGDRLVDIADLSVVWVWAQFYENEIALLKKQPLLRGREVFMFVKRATRHASYITSFQPTRRNFP